MLLNLRKHQRLDIDKRYQLRINVKEKLGIKELKNPQAFIDYSETIHDIYENLEN